MSIKWQASIKTSIGYIYFSVPFKTHSFNILSLYCSLPQNTYIVLSKYIHLKLLYIGRKTERKRTFFFQDQVVSKCSTSITRHELVLCAIRVILSSDSIIEIIYISHREYPNWNICVWIHKSALFLCIKMYVTQQNQKWWLFHSHSGSWFTRVDSWKLYCEAVIPSFLELGISLKSLPFQSL